MQRLFVWLQVWGTLEQFSSLRWLQVNVPATSRQRHPPTTTTPPCTHERDGVSADAYEYLPLFFSSWLCLFWGHVPCCFFFSFPSLSSHTRLITSLWIPTRAHVTPAFLSRFFIFPLAASGFLLLLFFNNNKTIVPYALGHHRLCDLRLQGCRERLPGNVWAEASGVGEILEKDLIEPGQMRARLGEPSAPFSLRHQLDAF